MTQPKRETLADPALEQVLEQLLGAAGRATVTAKDPPWVLPRPDVNPVYLEPVPAAFVTAIEATDQDAHDGPRIKAITDLVRHINAEVHSAIIEGGRRGVSASHLYWAWQDAGFGEFGHQGDIISNLSACGLIAYDPSLESDQQVVALADVVNINWSEDGS